MTNNASNNPGFEDLITSTGYETHDTYKTWLNDVSFWANTIDLTLIMKIIQRPQDAPQ